MSPSLISVLPSGRSISSAIDAISASSGFEADANSGTPLIRSIFELCPSASPTILRLCYAARQRTSRARSALAPGTSPAAPAAHQVDAREPGPLLVRREQLGGLVELDPAAPERGAELDEAEIADEPVAVAAEAFERDHAERPRPEPALAQEPRLDRLDRPCRAGASRSSVRQTRTSVDARCVASPSRRSSAGESAPIASRVGAARRTRARSPARSRARASPRSAGRRPPAGRAWATVGAAQRPQAVQAPDRRSEQRVVAEAAGELGRVGVEREQKRSSSSPSSSGARRSDEPVRALPRLPAAAAGKRRLERSRPYVISCRRYGPRGLTTSSITAPHLTLAS